MPGDVIMTGSPSGNGTHYGRYLQDGDEMRGEIDGLVGAQVVRCAAEQVAALEAD
jgi:2-keto-4-pentenoate hydratase/2-oxohepta-3-ene-1,7-dioic acid hydratase in catechol pathway